jgi:tetratricopeptide (TPR) repeat protein
MAGPAADAIRDHLARCAACRGQYAEAVRQRARALAGREPEAVDAGLLEAARRIPERAARGTARIPSSPRWRPGWRRVLPASVGAALVFALAFVLGRTGTAPRDPLGGRERAQLVSALAEGSLRGMILPGAEAASPPNVPATRSGAARHEGALTPVVARLARLTEDQRAPASVYVDLAAAYLALDRVADAQGTLDSAGRRFPADPRLLTLRAIAAYRDNRLENAERWLRRALDADPRYPPARFNLALLLRESGRSAEARAAGARLGAPSAGSLLRARLVEIGVAR